MRAWAALPVLSMGRMVSSVATTCEARTRSAINSYSGSAYMLDALEAAENILDLPALFSADFFALHTAAGAGAAGALLRAQFINVREDGGFSKSARARHPLRRSTRRRCSPDST